VEASGDVLGQHLRRSARSANVDRIERVDNDYCPYMPFAGVRNWESVPIALKPRRSARPEPAKAPPIHVKRCFARKMASAQTSQGASLYDVVAVLRAGPAEQYLM
jgi:hypothetical protein